MEKMKQHPILCSIFIAVILGACLAIALNGGIVNGKGLGGIDFLFAWFVFSVFLVYPFILTVINIAGSFIKRPENEKIRRIGKHFEYITIFLGVCYSGLLMMVTEIVFTADWQETLYNSQLHTPVWTLGYPTVIVLSLLGVMGYLVLSQIRLDKMPPLVIVISIASMYLGVMECILWIIQIFMVDASSLLLSLFPFNCIVIAVKTIHYKMTEWNAMEEHKGNYYDDQPLLKILNNKLAKAEYWPLAAFVLMWPLLGIVICVLALFGQKPDSVIKAWTETSDWNLSKQTAPPNVLYDEHYLCTVAAGGHEKIVKPIRMGERHGHRVVVNRQLCVANAFEQILEERMPGFHKHVRHFYDTYGFPVARLIRSRYTADLVYYIMKPLEWIFLIVLYFCDVKPENRIAVQYLPGKVFK